MHLGGFQKGAEEWCSGGCRECGSKCVSVRVCVCENFWRCWRCKRELGGVSVFPLCLSIVGRLLVLLFMLDSPTHTAARTSFICARCCTRYTHTQIYPHTHTHVTWVSLFWFAAEIKPGSVTLLYKRDKERLSHIQCVCVLEWENVCVCGVCCCESVSPMQSFYFLHLLQAGFSASLAGILVPFFFFFPQPDGLIAFCVFVCVRVYTSVWQRHICVPTGPPGPAWHTSLQKWANDTQVAGRHTLKSSRKMLLMI